MEKKRGTCFCGCGGVVLDSSDTIIVSQNALLVSCRQCFKVWDYEYAYSKQRESGNIVLKLSEQDEFRRQSQKG